MIFEMCVVKKIAKIFRSMSIFPFLERLTNLETSQTLLCHDRQGNLNNCNFYRKGENHGTKTESRKLV
jgi:hypothetical protein